MKFTCNFLNNF